MDFGPGGAPTGSRRTTAIPTSESLTFAGRSIEPAMDIENIGRGISQAQFSSIWRPSLALRQTQDAIRCPLHASLNK